ncbi:aldehyde dehydrogenase family protein [Microbacterium atlanticum]|uniref:aldehyde dehydrogenase family protein n=1 Tax=Microbacterium atlanticum TaxID=2782168 RepID=UPI001887BA9C|nr:aldehyde dehydrogenase family protein [Microbacterium atlanticum]
MPSTAKASAPPRRPAEAPVWAPALESAIADLTTGAAVWTQLTLDQRARLLERVRATVVSHAEEWATTSARTKGLDASHPLVGEEWLGSPYGALVALDGYVATLRKLAAGGSPLDGVRIDEAPGGRVRVHVFPAGATDRVLLSGFRGEVWLQPGVTAAEAVRAAGLGQLTPTQPGGIGLVLGAGNQSSIPVLDVLYELVASNRVVLLKVNPTQDELVSLLTQALAPLVELGLLRIVTGGPEVGEYLTQHAAIGHVHITGAAATFDAIVWGPATGPGAAQTARRRREHRPRLRKPITAELGGVSPIIVVPGRWTEADLRFQAEHAATMRLYNSGHNCIAAQVVIVSEDWPQRDAFLAALRTAYDAMPSRPVWYPRADEQLAAAASDYPDAHWNASHDRAFVELGPGDDPTPLQQTEYFAPVLGVVTLPGLGQEFLDTAVAHANDRLAGTLGANIMIDPVTERALGDGFERAVAALRYGSIAVNTWTAFGYLNAAHTWGGFPGATLDDVGSGIGVVHNALLLDSVERSVVRGPFRPFPRSLSALGGTGIVSVLAKPPWFASSRTAAAVSEGFTRFQMDHDWARFSRTIVQSLRA